MKKLIKNIISSLGNVIFFFKKEEIVKSDVKKILVISLYFKGDVLMNTPAVRLLKNLLPEAEIDIWVKSRTEAVIKNNPNIKEVILFDKIKTADYNDCDKAFIKEKIRFIKILRKNNYDLCIDLTGKYSTALISLLGGFKYSVGLNYNGFGFCYSKFVNTDTQHTAGHLAGKYCEVIKKGLNVSDKEYVTLLGDKVFENDLSIDKNTQAKANYFLVQNGIGNEEGYIAIQPAAGWSAKEWSPDKYSELINKLSENYKTVILGSDHDKKLLESVCENSGADERCITLSSQMEISAAVIGGSVLFIGSDSVGLQTAGALGIPSVALFGPTNPGFSNPPGEIHKIIYNKLNCSASVTEQYCTRDAGKSCPDIQCMKSIQVSEVLAQADLLLKQQPKKSNNKNITLQFAG